MHQDGETAKAPERATEKVLIKLTPSELRAVNEAAAGYPSRAAWIKGLLAAGAKVARERRAAA